MPFRPSPAGESLLLPFSARGEQPRGSRSPDGAQSGHSPGTVDGFPRGSSTQKCPSRKVRPEGIEPPTLRFEA